MKVLYDKFELDTLPGRITLGVLVLQDLWSILFLAVQPSLTAPEVGPLLRALGLGVALVLGAFAAARYVLPRVFRGAARSPELMVLGAIAWCFLVAGLASRAGLSAEMGALTAGLAMSYLPYKPDIVAKVTTVRDFFLTLFFVALGLKVAAPTWALAGASVAIAAFVLVSRFVVMFPLLRWLGAGDRAGLVVSMNLWPASEFALVLTAIGLKLGAHRGRGPRRRPLHHDPVGGRGHLPHGREPPHLRPHPRLARATRLRPRLGDRPRGRRRGHGADHPIVLLGFHRTASALLHELETTRPDLLPQVHVVDFNPVVLDELRRRGISCAYGDLANPDTLHHAGVASAQVALSSIPDTLLKGTTNRRILGHLKHLCPSAKHVVTAETTSMEQALFADGAAAVLVPYRAAATAALTDVLALLEGREAPSAATRGAVRNEILK